MRFLVLLLSLLAFNSASSSVVAQQRHLHSSAGVGSNKLPMYVAKDLGLFEKYGLNVELIVITGGARIFRKTDVGEFPAFEKWKD